FQSPKELAAFQLHWRRVARSGVFPKRCVLAQGAAVSSPPFREGGLPTQCFAQAYSRTEGILRCAGVPVQDSCEYSARNSQNVFRRELADQSNPVATHSRCDQLAS